MEIFLRRHSTTQSNLLRQYTGSTDVPLCEEGIALAKRQPARPDVGLVYVSSLRRTAQTAHIFYPNAAQQAVPGLDEMSFGAFEGHSWEDMQYDAAYAAWVDSGGTAPCPGGESREGFTERCCAAFLAILQKAGEEEELHIVAHGGTLMALMSEYGLPRRDYYDWLAPGCGGYRLRLAWEGEQPALHLLEEIRIL